MDSLRYSIGLRAHGQRDPLIEYKAEAFKIFEELMVNIKTEICHNIFRSASSLMAFENFLRNVPQQTTHQSTSAFGGTTTGTGTGARRRRGPVAGQRHRQRSRRRGGKGQAGPGRAQRSAATTPARAAAGRNTSSAAEKRKTFGFERRNRLQSLARYCPGGTSENSPTLQRWDCVQSVTSPEGTAEAMRTVSAVPSGLSVPLRLRTQR